ncbi:ABC transporter permease [Luteimonas aquatica]|uniref:ABC transporter permease n=1 Tax=Luteimonas aquatica TaxID=450364 RepID=UPI001F5AE0AD|nr:FtsX-like permease family protein [Luteimonas aquatica]
MHLRPILSTLMRHKTAALLLVLEIAVTCAIVANALFIVAQRAEGMRRPSGVDEDRLIQMSVSGVGKPANIDAITREDLQALRAIPGVERATITNQLPFLTSSSSNSGIALSPDQEQSSLGVAFYRAGEEMVGTLGLKIVSGRDFAADEYVDVSRIESMTDSDLKTLRSPILVNTAVANKLFPGQNAVGKVVYIGPIALTIIGVVQTLGRPNWSDGNLDYAMILPIRETYDGGIYVLRVKDPAERERVMREAAAALDKVDARRMLIVNQTYQTIRSDFFRNDRSMVALLVTVCLALLVVTALGIVGLASFWVQQRTKQIGVRRALGATRGQILRYFQAENFLLATLGIVLGMLLAYGINQLLMARYELPRLPLLYLPIGAGILWLLGQVAVFWPARRAASVPPAVATRSV